VSLRKRAPIKKENVRKTANNTFLLLKKGKQMKSQLTLKDKKKKCVPLFSSDIYSCFGAIEGVIMAYKDLKIMSAELAMDDVKDIVESYKLSHGETS